ncbi:S-receptor-like serine/threonine-protein kinase [Parasponia andersonii]|uniref:Receptor-like serine/threonine-protein kinase n=1 Tax=Parasponia andersonii TaxID=3476 RepID=A0A2P5DGX2_PARAD|nr:S-receptor-like serine/threonine-protein kinase [Parasponia andersonii]
MLRGEALTRHYETKNYPSESTSQIRLGSLLSPLAHSSWSSQSGLFEFGFYEQDGNGFAIGIWLAGGLGNDRSKTVVWTANRDDPPVTHNAKLVFTYQGKLLLRTEKGQDKLIANTTRTAFSASMHDSGDFVLYDEKSNVVWRSFEHPTDTILQGQILPTGGQLFSSLSETDHSTGRFRLKMQDDGNLVLYPANTEGGNLDAYWSSQTYLPNSGKLYFYLNSTGLLSIKNTSNSEIVRVLNAEKSLVNDNKITIIYRATLDANGILRLYSHVVHDENGKLLRSDSVVWSALDNPCEVKGFCGFNSYCTLYDAVPDCICLPGTEFVDPNHRTFGCLRNYFRFGCRGGKENVSFYNITEMENIHWEDTPYMETQTTMEECRKSCLEDCNCAAAIFEQDKYGTFGNNYCRKQKLPLRYVRRYFGEHTAAFFKVGKRRNKTRNNETDSRALEPPKLVVTTKKALMQILGLALGFIVLSCVALAISALYIVKIRVLRYKKLRDDGTLGMSTTNDQELTLRVFSYNDLKRATNDFKEELGKGSFGAVYRGALNKGRKLVAVKRLEKLVEEGEKEFRAEMRAIGRANHKNLVRLLGYCAEGSKRLLVYEYMSNGSLADLLFTKNARTRLDWIERMRIAIDVARGILYLHEECKAPIIHCDIKPQNILMDDFWSAKISDFGLAKFLMPDQTRTFTGIRGTRGYLAPEWHKNTPISVKADVYSYGIVLLEVVCCRKNLEINVPNPEEIILSNWVYKCFSTRELNKLVVDEEEDKKTLENMVKVGLWCIQDEPALRPSMKSVVLMLEGITDVSIPPCPTSSTM